MNATWMQQRTPKPSLVSRGLSLGILILTLTDAHGKSPGLLRGSLTEPLGFQDREMA